MEPTQPTPGLAAMLGETIPLLALVVAPVVAARVPVEVIA
jgi:hypothetical protein